MTGRELRTKKGSAQMFIDRSRVASRQRDANHEIQHKKSGHHQIEHESNAVRRHFGAGAENKVSEWAEMLITDTAKSLAYYDQAFCAKYSVITRNSFGNGTLIYEGQVKR
jgi:hypothetical protein